MGLLFIADSLFYVGVELFLTVAFQLFVRIRRFEKIISSRLLRIGQSHASTSPLFVPLHRRTRTNTLLFLNRVILIHELFQSRLIHFLAVIFTSLVFVCLRIRSFAFGLISFPLPQRQSPWSYERQKKR